MLRAGLTGGLGSGKSTVAEIFRSLGAHVIEADTLGRKLMVPGQPVYNAIVEHFGPGVVRSDGKLDRRVLADLAFRRNRLAELNLIVHPPVVAAQQELTDKIFARYPSAVVIVESALIFEADRQGSAPGWRQRFDRIMLVTAPEEQRIARYVDRLAEPAGAPPRENLEADARARIAAQIPDAEKIPLADFVIDNSGSLDNTHAQVRSIYAELVRASEQNR